MAGSLVRNDAGEIVNGKTALERFVCGGEHGRNRLLEGLAPVHVERVQALVNILARHWDRAPAPGHMEDFAKIAVASHECRNDPVRTGPPSKDRRSGTVAKEHTRVAVVPIDDRAELVRANDQNYCRCDYDELLGDLIA
jgi:hypothetical protein